MTSPTCRESQTRITTLVLTSRGWDVLSRVIFGTRTTLTVAFAAVLFGTTMGSLIGIVSAYAGGKVDSDTSSASWKSSRHFPTLFLRCYFFPRWIRACGQGF